MIEDIQFTYYSKDRIKKKGSVKNLNQNITDGVVRFGIFATRNITNYSRIFIRDLLFELKSQFHFFMTYEVYLRIGSGFFPRDVSLTIIFDENNYLLGSKELVGRDRFVLKIPELSKRHFYLLKDLFILELIDSIVILEATKFSKNLSIVASVSAEKSKNVYCLPGRYLDPSSYGTNKLIFDGAIPLFSLELLKN